MSPNDLEHYKVKIPHIYLALIPLLSNVNPFLSMPSVRRLSRKSSLSGEITIYFLQGPMSNKFQRLMLPQFSSNSTTCNGKYEHGDQGRIQAIMFFGDLPNLSYPVLHFGDKVTSVKRPSRGSRPWASCFDQVQPYCDI